MDDCQFKEYEELLRALGYRNCNEESRDNKNNEYNENTKSSTQNNCNDMIGGFQQMYPQLFVVVGEIIGNVVARKLPINVQDSIGNWLQLVGQVILTYNAQQQYFQGGPGRYFNEAYFNINNPLCDATNQEYDERGRIVNGSRRKNRDIKYADIRSSKEKQLKREIRELKKSIEKLQYEIDKLKGC